MKNILCITYRDWAAKIYDALEASLPELCFKIIKEKSQFSENIVFEFDPDIILWYGWSWIVPDNILNSYDCICLHPSPLPKYRGGSPIQNQIINNEKMSAVTIFKMTKDIDAGKIIKQLPMSLDGKIQDIFNRMFELGFSATYDFLKNGYEAIEQNHEDMTYFTRKKPSDSEITHQEILTKDAGYIYNKIRMLTDPYPNAYIEDKHGKRVYIKDCYYE